MDRIEVGIVSLLIGLVIQLWMLWDLPGQIQKNRRDDAISSKIIADAHAQDLKGSK
jgi:hypothetical protein